MGRRDNRLPIQSSNDMKPFENIVEPFELFFMRPSKVNEDDINALSIQLAETIARIAGYNLTVEHLAKVLKLASETLVEYLNYNEPTEE